MEFCDKCGGLLMPESENGKTFLECRYCDERRPLTEEIVDSYSSTLNISHNIGDEYKNAIEMEKWKEKIE
ncbi:MAG: hypothetical protein EU529_04320 [Promethearchaeota archaeon]|nr:MAG: hypothetical protein EU529_04320 [Candidatus Lokiarchaeota archaeon]